jgi:putative tricarboxylic transport membrane protein
VTSGDVTPVDVTARGDLTASPTGTPKRSTGALMVALAAIALGIFVLQEAVTGANQQSYAFVGPGVFPLIIGAVQIVVGVALLWQAWHGAWQVVWADAAGQQKAAGTSAPSPLAKVSLIAIALILDVALMQPAGFVLASTVLFCCVTRAFGSRRLLLDVALGLVFTGIVFVVFVHGLGLSLPVGWLWEGIPWMS